MRKRYQTGGVRKQRGCWSGFWRVDGCRKSKVLGFVKDMTKSDGLAADIAMWRRFVADTKAQAFVFASERKIPLAKENVWRRNILPRLSKIGLEWANFQVMRRTHASIMKELGVDPKWVADQPGHSLDVNQNVYTQVFVEQRLEAVQQQLETALVL